MTTFNAATTAELLGAISRAVDGDSILLATGTYSGVNIANVTKSGNVTISSADSDHPAVLTDLSVKNSAGLTFSNLEMFVTRDAPFQVYGSSRIAFDRLDVHGTLNGSSNDDYRGMVIRESNTVIVSNSHFHELTSALSHINTQGVVFTGNSFDMIRDDGICGGGSSNITVSNNRFTNFDHVGDVHPDAIQFWTSNTSASASNITVTGNVFDRGTGTAIQGIWISDEVGTLPFQNVSVTNNVVIGALYNGIVVNGAASATMAGNVVIAGDDQLSWLGVRGTTAAITDNQASSFNFTNSTVTSAGNVLIATMAAAALAQLSLPATGASPGINSTDLSGLPASLGVSLTGFIDGASPTGLAYQFTEVRLDGTSGADRLTAGTVGASHLYGYDGNDTLVGSRNGIASTLEGGKGDDIYTIYQANDVIVEQAGEGNDSVYTYVDYTLSANVENARAFAAGLTIHGNALANGLTAHAGGSILYGEGGDDFIQGSTGSDALFGGDGNDRIAGGGGDDILDGGAGNDALSGGDGNDVITGGAGNDTIEGGAGVDTLTGGDGADTFTFRNGDCAIASATATKDTITDFKASDGDIINLTMIDAKTATPADDAFTFIGSQAFHHVAGELRFEADGDGITLYGDTDGDGVADIGIHLTGVTSITASNMYL